MAVPDLLVVVLAAGQGKRMCSALPKVLHPICGRPMLHWVLSAAAATDPAEIVVVVGHSGEEVEARTRDLGIETPVRFVTQSRQNGTGDAMSVALASVEPDDRDLLVLPGDSPLISTETLRHMIDDHDRDHVGVTLLTAVVDDPTGYGRIIRHIGGAVSKIVEHRDATPSQREINEIAVSTYVFSEHRLRDALARLRPDNDAAELYLTDAIEDIFPDVNSVAAGSDEILGVNDRGQLAAVEGVARRRLLGAAMSDGVTIQDPANTYLDAGVELAEDVTILAGCHLEGATSVGVHSVIGPGVRLVDARVGRSCELSYCVVRESVVDDGAQVGPYASLRPATHLGSNSKIGTFVETKKTSIGSGSKIPHLSYIGDATIADDVNLGANTITCNWDGQTKHHTNIGSGVRTGSGSLLVAPLTLGDDAHTGAGAVVTSDVPDGALAKGMPAVVEEGWTERNRRS